MLLRYVSLADVGVYPYMNYTDIIATEGDNVFIAFEIYIEKEDLANIKESLYHVINDMKTPVNIMPVIIPQKSFPCNPPYPNPPFCQCTIKGEIAHVFKVMLTNLTTANAGIYLLEVPIGGRNFSASITLSGKIFSMIITIINFIYFLVTPLTITSTSTTIISPSSTTPSSSQTISPSPSPSSSSTPIGKTPIHTHTYILVHNNNIHVLCIDHLPHTFLE